jgi:malate dehydrogenase (oxaloacetate-decarboxylating)(NADP+)
MVPVLPPWLVSTCMFRLGAKPENFCVFDIKGPLHRERTDLEEFKLKFANAKADTTLDKAMKDADVFVGLSVGNVVTPIWSSSMAKNPIVFAMANPDPEIGWEEATAARKDVIMATGRSDYPQPGKQCTGLSLHFPWCLDVRATQINEAMKLAAVKALAEWRKRRCRIL